MTDDELLQITRRTGSGLASLLGELESAIMRLLWDEPGPLTVREVLNALNRRHVPPVAYTTILTVMARLTRKGLLLRELVGVTHRYRARLTEAQFLHDASEQVARRMIQDFGSLAIAGFMSAVDTADPAQLQQLRELLRENSEE